MERLVYIPKDLKFVNEPVARQVSERYVYVTHQIVDVGETMLRTTIRDDIEAINEIRQINYNGIHEVDNSMTILRNIMNGNGQRTSLLSKVLALDAYHDLWHQYDYMQSDFPDFFNDLVLAEPEKAGGIILYGAFYAKRILELSGKNIPTDEIIKTMDHILIGNVNNEQTELKRIAIHSSGFALAQMLENQELKLGMPWAIIHENEDDKPSLRKEGGYPESIMFLAVNRLPRLDKLYEATVHGVPQRSGVNKYRCLRVMVGEEIPDEYIFESQATHKLITEHNRRFSYVYVPSLLVPTKPTVENFSREENYTDFNVLEKSSFDALSFWAACRAADKLEDQVNNIRLRYSKKDGDKYIKLEKQTENKAIDRAINSIISSLCKENYRSLDKLDTASILSVAMEDSGIVARSDEERDKIKLQLFNNIKTLVLRHEKDNWQIRTREEIGDLFSKSVWMHLPSEDRIQFGLYLLYPKSPYYQEIDREETRIRIEKAIKNETPLDKNDTILVERVAKNHVILRCETIRNTYEPETMRRLRLMNDPS